MDLDKPAWDEILSLNHPVIDQQHQEILHRVHNLPRRDDRNFDQAMQFFLRYTFDHFRDEEALMTANNYPGTSNHQKAHREIEATFDQHFNRYLKDDINYSDFKAFLNTWISQHILKEDRKFAQFLAKRPRVKTDALP
ncbi:MAG TPA: hemerythrin family protein [Geothermobacteraceae bacterium]|nr:hemerythrin family protein [Geothermobacteraceae bacterium]